MTYDIKRYVYVEMCWPIYSRYPVIALKFKKYETKHHVPMRTYLEWYPRLTRTHSSTYITSLQVMLKDVAGLPIRALTRKETNQLFYKTFNIPPATLRKYIWYCLINTYIKPYQVYIDKLARGHKGRYQWESVARIITNEEGVYNKLKEVHERDRLTHLLPFVFVCNKTPKELKQYLGKAIWKKLACNSFTRNKYILSSKILHSERRDELVGLSSIFLRYIPLTSHFFPWCVDTLLLYHDILKKFKKLSALSVQKFAHYYSIIDDIEDIEKSLGVKSCNLLKFNSLEEIEAYHDELAADLKDKNYSKNIISDGSDFNDGNYKLVCMKSAWDINWLADKLHNCMSCHIRRVRERTIDLYAIYRKEKLIGGLSLTPDYKIQEIKGPCNNNLDNITTKKINNIIVANKPKIEYNYSIG